MQFEFDILGDLLSVAIKYLDSGFQDDLVLHDGVTNTDVMAKHLFYDRDGRYFLRDESVPGDLSIKAIAIDDNGLYLETSSIKSEDVSSLLSEEMIPLQFIDGNLVDIHKYQQIILVSKPEKPSEEFDMRCLLSVPFKKISVKQRDTAIRMLDLMFTRNCFESEEDEIFHEPTSQKLRLKLGLQQKLALEQRPYLSLLGKLSAKVELSPQLGAMLSLECKMMSMTKEELLEFILKHASQHGEERTKQLLFFALAGRIKRVAPKVLTWKQARKLAKTMASKEHR